MEADPVDAAAPVGADEPIGACIGLVYSELRSASVRFPKVEGALTKPYVFRIINLGFNTIPSESRIKVGMKNITP